MPVEASREVAPAETEREYVDRICLEDDGCPTEGAVLKRAWREHRAEIERLQDALEESHKIIRAYEDARREVGDEMERLRKDRDEWKAQHENLLSVRATDNATLLGHIDAADRIAKINIGVAGKIAEENERLRSAERFYLSRDNDSHWFVIPVAKAAEWEAWCGLDQDSPEAWNVPDFAQEVGGSPGLVTFLAPEIR